MTDFPVEHLSASSITTFLRCPRQWQDKYIRGNRGPSNSALMLGSAVHLGLSRALKGEDPGSFWLETLKENPEVDWSKMAPDKCAEWAVKLLYLYYETIGKHLNVTDTEVEVLIEIPGMDIPVIGFIDILTDDRVVDVKTTGYFSAKQVRLNPEWKFQMNVYQIFENLPGEFHVLTRAKTDPIRVPTSINDPLYVYPPDPLETARFIRQTYQQIKYAWETWGDEEEWPGGVTHEWAGRYCDVENCCQKG